MLVEFICSKCHQVKPCMMKNGETICIKCAKETENVDETLGFPVIKKSAEDERGHRDFPVI